jgi:tetratricopeptide (TPR) repeat protein
LAEYTPVSSNKASQRGDFYIKFEGDNLSSIMNYIYARFGLMALFAILGVFFHLQFGIGGAWYFYLALAVLLFTHLFFGSVWLALQQIQQGQLQKARKLLRYVVNPNWLIKRNRGYFYFVKGLIDMQDKNLDAARLALEEAHTIGLGRKNDRALTLLNLAHIHLVQKDVKNAKVYAQKATDMQPTDLMIKQNLEKLRQALGMQE